MIILRSHRWPQKDIIRRKFIFKFESNKFILKGLLSNSMFPLAYKYAFTKRLSKYTKNHSISYCRNHCSERVMGKSVFRFSRMSRYVTKYYASWGYIIGIRRSSS